MSARPSGSVGEAAYSAARFSMPGAYRRFLSSPTRVMASGAGAGLRLAALPDRRDERAGRAAVDERDGLDEPAVALDQLVADDGLGGVVPALDQNVGTDHPDGLDRRVLVEDDDEVHRVERRQDSQPGRLA